MATDLIPLAATVPTAVVAVMAIRATQATAAKDREAAQVRAELAMRQAKLQDTYVDALTFAGEFGAWAQTMLPAVGGDPNDAQAIIGPPPVERQIQVEAQLAAFGSQEVRTAVAAWKDILGEVRVLVHQVQIRYARKDLPTPAGRESISDWFTPWGKLEDLRPKEHEARRALEELVRDELGTIRKVASPSPESAKAMGLADISVVWAFAILVGAVVLAVKDQDSSAWAIGVTATIVLVLAGLVAPESRSSIWGETPRP